MTTEEAKTQYIESLRAIVAADPTIGPLIAERSKLIAANVPASAGAMVAVNNRIRNSAGSDDAMKAIKALRDLRLGA